MLGWIALFSQPTNGFVAEWLGRGLQNLLQQFESARNLKSPALKRGILVMKYSQLLGCLAVILLAGICFLPWSFIDEKQTLITGMSAPGTVYGKPGLMHFVLGFILILFFLIPKIWAKRINVFIAAINLAWSIRNYILLTTCFMGECPEKRYGLYLELLFCTSILIFTFLPDLNTLEKPKS